MSFNAEVPFYLWLCLWLLAISLNSLDLLVISILLEEDFFYHLRKLRLSRQRDNHIYGQKLWFLVKPKTIKVRLQALH